MGLDTVGHIFFIIFGGIAMMLGFSFLLYIFITQPNNPDMYTSSSGFWTMIMFAALGSAVFAFGFVPERHRIIGFLRS